MINRNAIRFFVLLGVLVLLYLGVALFSSIVQIAAAADRVYAGMGQPVFWGLTSLFLVCAISPVVLYLRFPKALVPPEEGEGPAHDAFMRDLLQRLAKNPRLKDVPLNSIDDIPVAMARLAEEADQVVHNTATTVFASTALLKNGRLDGLVLLLTQTRMIWKISTIFYQRPSPRQMVYLYSNVCASALLADSIDEIDFSELITPMVVAIAPSMKGAVPGFQGISALLVNCIASGAANAFLTLRVGAVARQYCESLVRPSREVVQKSATAAAMGQIFQITKENGARIAKTVLDAAGGFIKDAAGATVQGVREAAGKAMDSAKSGAKAVGGAIDSTVQNVKSGAGRIKTWRGTE